jgi:hypothetical protein
MVATGLIFMLAGSASGLRNDVAAEIYIHSTNVSTSAGIGELSAEDAANKKWTFFFKEWCPSTQQVFAELYRKGLLSAFIEKVGTDNMRCFSSFEDFIGSSDQNQPEFGIKNVHDLLNKFHMLDPNDFPGRSSSLEEIPCDRHFTKGENTVRDEMAAAWENSHDESCTDKYGNGPYTVPALVIGKKKFCETRLLRQWLSDNMEAVSESGGNMEAVSKSGDNMESVSKKVCCCKTSGTSKLPYGDKTCYGVDRGGQCCKFKIPASGGNPCKTALKSKSTTKVDNAQCLP